MTGRRRAAPGAAAIPLRRVAVHGQTRPLRVSSAGHPHATFGRALTSHVFASELLAYDLSCQTADRRYVSDWRFKLMLSVQRVQFSRDRSALDCCCSG